MISQTLRVHTRAGAAYVVLCEVIPRSEWLSYVCTHSYTGSRRRRGWQRRRLYMVADGLGPEDISQRGPGRILKVARSQPLRIPESAPARGSKAKASPLLEEQACNSNEILPVPSYPGSVSSVKGRSSLCTCSTTECVALLWRLAHAVETWCLRLQLRPEMRATFAQIMDSWILSSVMKFQV